MSSVYVVLVFLLAALGPTRARADVCEVNGASINLDNGHSLYHLTGTIVCRDLDGVVYRQVGYEDGKKHGLEIMFRSDKTRTETAYQHGAQHGPERGFDEKGRLRSELPWVDGKQVGDERSFSESGKLVGLERTIGEGVRLTFSYAETGQLTGLRCGATPREEVGRRGCPYQAPGELVQIYYRSGTLKQKIPLKNGLREGSSESFYPDGKLAKREEFKAGMLSGKSLEQRADGTPLRRAMYLDDLREGPEETFFEDGKLAERNVWHGYTRLSSETMWQNGKRRSKRTLSGQLEQREEFYDDGQPKTAETWAGKRLHGRARAWWPNGQLKFDGAFQAGQPTGENKTWFEDGELEKQETWKDGSLIALKQYSARGKLLKDEHYHQDGSRY
jgi:antitoxin component YwqK of YwqJK toxin-antitoxin module